MIIEARCFNGSSSEYAWGIDNRTYFIKGDGSVTWNNYDQNSTADEYTTTVTVSNNTISFSKTGYVSKSDSDFWSYIVLEIDA